jgi:hypothetical protein
MTMMPSFVPGNFAMMLRTGNFPSTVSAVKASSSHLVAFQMVEDVALQLLVILVAHVTRAEGGDFAGVFEGALGIDVRERGVVGSGGRGFGRRNWCRR